MMHCFLTKACWTIIALHNGWTEKQPSGQAGDNSSDERMRMNLELSTGVAIPLSLCKEFMRPPVEFVEALQKTAAEYFAASATGGGFEFVERVYDHWSRSDSGSDMTAWLIDNLGRYFRWTDQAPRWIEDYPAWPFHRGDPMVFIGQQTVHGDSRDELPNDCSFYLFIGWDDEPEGRRMVTRVITQNGTITETVSCFNKQNFQAEQAGDNSSDKAI